MLDFGDMVALQHPPIFKLGYDEMGGVVLAHGPPVAREGIRRSYGALRGVLNSIRILLSTRLPMGKAMAPLAGSLFA